MLTKTFLENELLELDVTYGSIEALLEIKGFKILHLMRDHNGDWGDDGGFIISLSSYNDHVYLHIIEVNYNNELSDKVLSEHDINERTSNHEYMKFKDINCALGYLNILTSLLNKYSENLKSTKLFVEEDGRVFGTDRINRDIPGLLEDISEKSARFRLQLSTLSFAFCDSLCENNELVKELTRTVYTPNFVYLGDDEHDESYEDDDFIIKVDKKYYD